MRRFSGVRKLGLEEQLDSKVNQFNMVRLFLALLVCSDHAGLIVFGAPGSEPIKIFGFSTGYLAVNGFFVLSGMLIARSLHERGISLSYFVSRLLRLYPALILLVIVAVGVVGPMVGSPSYWQGLNTFSYAFEVLHFGDTMGGPINFYTNNPLPGEYDSPLWTLRFEVVCYFTAPFIVLFGLHNRPLIVASILALMGSVLVVAPPSHDGIYSNFLPSTNLGHHLSSSLRLAFSFGLGMLIWQMREHIRGQFSWVVGSTVIFMATHYFEIGHYLAATLWIASVVLFFGLRWPAMQPIKTDLSYGLYIWHFPVMQIILGEFGISSWQLLWLIGVPITLCIAWASWTFVEKPALNLKKYVPNTPKPSWGW